MADDHGGVTFPDSAITADPAFFDDRDESMSVFVETDEVEQAVRALMTAFARLEWVTFDGTEYAGEDEWSAADLASGGSFETTNANFVHDVESGPGGASLLLDTKGAAPSAMGRTVVRIVTEELERVGIERAILRPFPPQGWQPQHRQRPAEATVEALIGATGSQYREAWFLIRQLYHPGRHTFRGVEYLHEDGSWAQGQTGAVRRDEAELSQADRDWCAALADDPRPDGVAQPGWQWLLVMAPGD